MKFYELNLNSSILNSIEKLGFKTPTPIQEKSIPILIKCDRDFIGLASTGTGKTAAFGLPILQSINTDVKNPQSIIIAPTRELCIQIHNDLLQFSSSIENIKIVAVYGGSSIEKQIKNLKQDAQIIVATPGRLLDLINRKTISLKEIKIVVLDEADEMLNMGFKEDLDKILIKIPKERLIWLFSATMAKGVSRIANDYLNNPHEISVNNRNHSAKNIKHYAFIINERDRFEALKRILDYLPNIYGVIFCRTRIETQRISEKLIANKYTAEALHGDLSQKQRDAVMKKFRQKNINILVATDVAARGIDIDDISHVIHYKLSDEIESYTHRSGRTARAGKSGISIALMNSRESSKINQLQKKNGITINIEKLPDASVICENQLLGLIEKVINCPINENEINKYLPPVYEALCHLDKKEIIKRFISVEFNHLLEYYRNTKDLNSVDENQYDENPRKKFHRKKRKKRNVIRTRRK